MNNKSYAQIYEKFVELFPEFKASVRSWGKAQFDSELRMIGIELKNGCYIYFGTTKDEGEWSWVASLDMSDKTKEKLGVTMEDS